MSLDDDEASMDPAAAASLELGQDAFKQHAWSEALDAFATADRAGGLSAEDLELMGEAAWWAGKPDEATDSLERAFAAYVAAARPTEAAGVAFHLSYLAFRRQAPSVGGGWLGRAAGMLEGVPESGMHAWLPLFAGMGAMMDHRMGDGLAFADRAIAVAREHGNADVQFMATSFKGYGEMHQGDMQLGLALLDEAAAAATSGQLDPRVASDILCNTIAACRNIGDLRRAGQWADEGERWMRRQALGGYPGICRVHRADLKMLRGQWPEAELEARQACEELQRFGLKDGVGYAYHEIGEIRLRMGDLPGAADAFERAYELGDDGQPGSALLHLARGETEEAWRSIERALDSTQFGEGPADQATRARLLPAAIEIALARGEMDTARNAVEELASIASGFKRPLFEAGALTAKGELLLGEDRPSEASPILSRSWRLWLDNDLPYESARARLRYAEAIAAEGDEATAHRDLRAARTVFERLGAIRDLQHVDALLGESSLPAAPAERVTKTLMFTDIVTSTDLIGVVGDEAWAELLAWHNRELRSSFASHRGEEVKSTGDGFFVTFDKASDGIDCAVDIQQRLMRHRREHGFAPSVRIGLHAAGATRDGHDYGGQGVHIAARVGGAASGQEILVTTEVLEQGGRTRYRASEPRMLTLKGVREPVEVRAIDWR
jgi:class 3 adenylate cyclase